MTISSSVGLCVQAISDAVVVDIRITSSRSSGRLSYCKLYPDSKSLVIIYNLYSS